MGVWRMKVWKGASFVVVTRERVNVYAIGCSSGVEERWSGEARGGLK